MAKKVYVVWNDIYHPKETYTSAVNKLFAAPDWELQTSSVAGDILKLDETPDLMVNLSFGEPDGVNGLSYTEQRSIKDMVERGMGIMYIHAGLARIKEDTPAYEIARGYFVCHPKPHYPTLVCGIPGIQHPILNGVEAFEEPDEHYFCKVDILKATPFLCSVSHSGTEVAGWTQKLGKGRVCCLTPGHTAPMLAKMEPLLKNAANWCVKNL